MRWFGTWVTAVAFAVSAAHAAPQGGSVAELAARLQAAESRLSEVQAQIAKSRSQAGEADTNLRQSVQAAVRLGQYPPGFWLMRSVVTDAPVQAGLVQAMSRQHARRMVSSQAEAAGLSRLYGQANQQLAALRQVQSAYADSRASLLQVERQVLRRAGMQAEALEGVLQAALEQAPVAEQTGGNKPVAVEDAAPEGVGGGLPVAGRVLRGFGRSEGATRDGVVLAAPEGAPVMATRAAKVLFAGPFRHFGGLVIVKTVRGEDMLLGGMGTLNVNAGDDVAAGQQLGLVGEEGRIYWEVRRRGQVVNPL